MLKTFIENKFFSHFSKFKYLLRAYHTYKMSSEDYIILNDLNNNEQIAENQTETEPLVLSKKLQSLMMKYLFINLNLFKILKVFNLLK